MSESFAEQMDALRFKALESSIRTKVTREAGNRVIAILKPQFPTSPEGRLMYGVIELAIKDKFHPSSSAFRGSANAYFSGDIFHAGLCGVDSDWIKLVLRRARLWIEAEIEGKLSEAR